MISNSLLIFRKVKFAVFFVAASAFLSLAVSSLNTSTVFADTCSDSGNLFARVDVFVRVYDHNNKPVGYGKGFKFNVTATTPDPSNYPAGSAARDLANIQKQRLLGNGASQPELSSDTYRSMAAINGPGGNPNASTNPSVPSQTKDFEANGSTIHYCQPAGGDSYWLSSNGVPTGGADSGERPAYDFTNGSNGNFILNCLGGAIFFQNPYNSIPNKWKLSASLNFQATGVPTEYVPFKSNSSSEASGNEVNISGGNWIGVTSLDIEPTNTDDINNLDRDIIFKYQLAPASKPKVTPNAGSDAVINLGDSFKFEAWAETEDANSSPDQPFKMEVKDMGPGGGLVDIPASNTAGETSDWGAVDRTTKPDREIPSPRQTFTFTPSSPGKYCRKIRIFGFDATKVNVPVPEEEQCVEVKACTGGVSLIARSYADGIEGGTAIRNVGDTTPVKFEHKGGYKRCGPGGNVWWQQLSGDTRWTSNPSNPYNSWMNYIASNYKYFSNNELQGDMEVMPGGTSYVVPANTQPGTYCQYLNISYSGVSWNNATSQYTPACVKVEPPDTYNKKVTLTPEMDVNTPDVEPGDPANFTGSVYVSGFPDFYADEWGYTQNAYAANANNMVQNPGYSGTRTSTQTFDAGYYYACQGGQVLDTSTPNPTDTRYDSCATTSTTPTCNSPSSGNSTSCPYTAYQYDCQVNDSGWTTSTSWTCTDRYICHTQYDGYYASQPTCNWWKCQYGASSQTYGIPSWPTSGAAQPFYDTSNPGSAKCQARCGGTGDLAGQALAGASIPDGSKYDQGDLNCYVRPEFSLTCRYIQSSPAGSTNSQSVTVTGNGQWCSQPSLTHTGNSIGTQACMRSTYNVPSSWNGTAPGIQMGFAVGTWGWQPSPPSSDDACANIIGKSYVRVVGGDAASGSGATTSANLTCSLGTGNISAWNDTANGNKGSGASVAVFANGLINGFVSGQFANPVLGGSNARPNTFANTNGSPFGGQWGGAPPCINTEKIEATSNSTSMPTTPITGVDKRKVMNQDVFISSNITYSTAGVNGIPGWQSVEDLPLFQLVVEGGNIYISENVTQLDGLYVAVKNASNPGKGNIYTCSTSIGSNVTATWSNCKRQLVVNGSLVAEKVFFARDCSTLKRAQSNEKTVFTGGTDEQFCNTASPGTRAAEVINYTPDIWIRSTLGVPSTNYDAVTTLPPVL